MDQRGTDGILEVTNPNMLKDDGLLTYMHLLLNSNKKVQISMWHGRDKHSSECYLVNFNAVYGQNLVTRGLIHSQS